MPKRLCHGFDFYFDCYLGNCSYCDLATLLDLGRAGWFSFFVFPILFSLSSFLGEGDRFLLIGIADYYVLVSRVPL